MKKLISITLILALFISIFTLSAEAKKSQTVKTYTSGDYKYQIQKNGKLKITEYIGNADDVTVPAELDEKKVETIGKAAFVGRFIKSLKVSSGISVIESDAFSYCDNLKSAELPSSVKTLGSYAFYNCVQLTSVKLSSGLKEIGAGAFYYCTKLPKLTIPNGVKFIKAYTFAYCKSLKALKLPDSVKNCYLECFDYSALRSISFGSGLKGLSYYIFTECPKLEKISVSKTNKYFSSKNGVLYDKKKTVLRAYPMNRSKRRFTFPSSVKEVYYFAFYGNNNLNSVKFNKKLEKIRSSAFSRCEKLTSVTFNKNLKFVDTCAFDFCKSLKKLHIKKNKNLKICNRAFEECKNLKKVTIDYIGEKWEGMIFEYCKNLKTVILKDGVKRIPYEMFDNCPKLKKIKIPSSVKEIDSDALGFTDEGPVKNFTIIGYRGTAAEKYARENKFIFKAV